VTKKIFWDKGHSGDGRDPGTVSNGLQEHQLVNKIVDYAKEYMNDNYTGFEQRQSRHHNTGAELSNRDDLADDWGADVFVSVHINAGKGTGFESFIYNGGVSKATQSLQNVVHNEILAAMRKFGSITDRGKKSANFAVLRETNMPAVLTENLFIDSNDHKHLKNESFLKAVGYAHARGVAKFLGLPSKPKKTVNKPKSKPSNDDLYKGQVGAFSNEKSAEKLANQLKTEGFKSYIVKE
jgi:N-acetylmuramoyl-L-alanine amidase